MKIENENGTLIYTIDDNEITLDDIRVIIQRKGTGKALIEKLKEISSELNLPIGLYSYPLDNKISQENLNSFYFNCGFRLDADDTDNRLMVWGL